MDDLRRQQEAGTRVEKEMVEFLLQFSPAEQLRVCDIKQIASYARALAFDAFRVESSP